MLSTAGGRVDHARDAHRLDLRGDDRAEEPIPIAAAPRKASPAKVPSRAAPPRPVPAPGGAGAWVADLLVLAAAGGLAAGVLVNRRSLVASAARGYYWRFEDGLGPWVGLGVTCLVAALLAWRRGRAGLRRPVQWLAAALLAGQAAFLTGVYLPSARARLLMWAPHELAFGPMVGFGDPAVGPLLARHAASLEWLERHALVGRDSIELSRSVPRAALVLAGLLARGQTLEAIVQGREAGPDLFLLGLVAEARPRALAELPYVAELVPLRPQGSFRLGLLEREQALAAARTLARGDLDHQRASLLLFAATQHADLLPQEEVERLVEQVCGRYPEETTAAGRTLRRALVAWRDARGGGPARVGIAVGGGGLLGPGPTEEQAAALRELLLGLVRSCGVEVTEASGAADLTIRAELTRSYVDTERYDVSVPVERKRTETEYDRVTRSYRSRTVIETEYLSETREADRFVHRLVVQLDAPTPRRTADPSAWARFKALPRRVEVADKTPHGQDHWVIDPWTDLLYGLSVLWVKFESELAGG